MGSISSIDDLLMGVGNSQQPATPEHKDKLANEKAEIEEDLDTETPSYDAEGDESDENDPPKKLLNEENDDSEEQNDDESSEEKPDKNGNVEESEVDEYGNPKERMSQGMKDRLDRKEKQFQREIEQRDHELQILRQQLAQQGASREVQQAAKDFKYDPNDENSWQQQLTEFVKQTVTSMNVEQEQKARSIRDEQAHNEFRKKFTQGMERFSDFREVVGAQPMDDAMTLALHGIADPAAFIYAASKRHPQDIERISKLPNPYARMVEMGKLEERMRRNKPTTQAPRPLGRTKEDATIKVQPKQKDMTGDDLLAKADAKRLATVRNRHRANR